MTSPLPDYHETKTLIEFGRKAHTALAPAPRSKAWGGLLGGIGIIAAVAAVGWVATRPADTSPDQPAMALANAATFETAETLTPGLTGRDRTRVLKGKANKAKPITFASLFKAKKETIVHQEPVPHMAFIAPVGPLRNHSFDASGLTQVNATPEPVGYALVMLNLDTAESEKLEIFRTPYSCNSQMIEREFSPGSDNDSIFYECRGVDDTGQIIARKAPSGARWIVGTTPDVTRQTYQSNTSSDGRSNTSTTETQW